MELLTEALGRRPVAADVLAILERDLSVPPEVATLIRAGLDDL